MFFLQKVFLRPGTQVRRFGRKLNASVDDFSCASLMPIFKKKEGGVSAPCIEKFSRGGLPDPPGVTQDASYKISRKITFVRLGVIVPGSNHAERLFFQKLTPEHCVR